MHLGYVEPNRLFPIIIHSYSKTKLSDNARPSPPHVKEFKSILMFNIEFKEGIRLKTLKGQNIKALWVLAENWKFLQGPKLYNTGVN